MVETEQAKKFKTLFPHSKYTYDELGNIVSIDLNVRKHVTSEIFIDETNHMVKVINKNPIDMEHRYWCDFEYRLHRNTDLFTEQYFNDRKEGIINLLDAHVWVLQCTYGDEVKITCSKEQYEEYANHLIHGILVKLDKAGLLKTPYVTNYDDLH